MPALKGDRTYRILRELGQNPTGGRVTYLAEDARSQQLVALKEFQFATGLSQWSGYDACQREIDILKGLDHPGIPRYLDSFATEKGFCLVQEYKDAQPLCAVASFCLEEIEQIAIALLEILVYLQERVPPVIHRDIKPENVLIRREQRGDRPAVYLIDFGFARLGGSDLAASSTVKGTLGFMPPEQLFGRALVPASDLYSLGVTLVCLLTGTKSTSIGERFDRAYRLNFKPLTPQLSSGWQAWLEKLLEPDPGDRFASAKAALDALRSLDIQRAAAVEIDADRLADRPVPLLRLAALFLGAGILSFGAPVWGAIAAFLVREFLEILKGLWSF